MNAAQSGTAPAIETDMTPTIGALAAALAKAQGAMCGAKKDSIATVVYKEGGTPQRRAYADLASVWEAIRAPLSANGLAIMQLTETVDRSSVCVVTMLVHASGEFVRTRLMMPVTKQDAQGFGSALTYARRYSLMAIAGIAAEDDDGEDAVQPAPRHQERAPSPTPKAPANNHRAELARSFAHRLREAGVAGDRTGITSLEAEIAASQCTDIDKQKLKGVAADAVQACARCEQAGAGQ